MASPKRDEEKQQQPGQEGNSSPQNAGGGGSPSHVPDPPLPSPPSPSSTQESVTSTLPAPSKPTTEGALESVTPTLPTPTKPTTEGGSGAAEGAQVVAGAGDQGSEGTITIAVPVSGGRKRRGSAGNEEAGGSSSGGQKAKRKPIEANVPPICAICSRSFNSFNALFGHMRAHKDKPWGRGAFPPPMGPQWRAPVLPPTAGTGEQSKEEQAVSDIVAAAQRALDQLDNPRAEIDLNVKPSDEEEKEPAPAEKEEEETAPAEKDEEEPPPAKKEEDPTPAEKQEEEPAPAEKEEEGSGLDLNRSPPKEDDA